MRELFFILMCLVLFSCTEKKEDGMIDLNDVIPSSERYAEGKKEQKDSVIVSYYDSISSFAQNISNEFQINPETISLIDSLWLPDRFDNKGIEKWNGETELGQVVFARYTFRDSLNMKNTLFNWFDCFGDNCNSVQLFAEKKIKNDPFIVYATEKEFIYVSTENLDEKGVLKQMESLYRNKKPMYVLSQVKGQKSKWWILDNKKWVELKKEEI